MNKLPRAVAAGVSIGLMVGATGCSADTQKHNSQAERQAQIDRLAKQTAETIVRMSTQIGERDNRAGRTSVAARFLADRPVFLDGTVSYNASDLRDMSAEPSLITIGYNGHKADPAKVDFVTVQRKDCENGQCTLQDSAVTYDDHTGHWSVSQEGTPFPLPTPGPNQLSQTIEQVSVGNDPASDLNAAAMKTAREISKDAHQDALHVLQLP